MLFMMMVETPEEHDKLDALFRKYEGLLFTIAYDIVKHEKDAEDVVQDTFLRAALNIKKIGDVNSSSTKCYLVTIAENLAKDRVREKERHSEVEYFEYFEDAVYEHTEFNLADIPDKEVLWRAMDKLPLQYRNLIVMKYMLDMENKKIAKTLELSMDNVRQRDKRARDSLRVALEEEMHK